MVKGSEAEERNKELAITVDAVGLFCPVPIVKLRLEMERVPSHEIVRVLADDPAFPEDVVSWCRETGNRLLSVRKNEEEVFVAYVEKHKEN